MKFSKKIRRLWHDVFYRNSSGNRLEFAMRCRDVTAVIDLRAPPKGISGKFRFGLHLSLCQACKNYDDLSTAFSKAIKRSPPPSSPDSDSINRKLLEKYGRKVDKGKN